MVRPTKYMHMQRLEEVQDAIASGLTDGEAKRRLSELWGCSPRSVERYLRRARAALIAKMHTSRDELIGCSMAFYEAVARDTSQKMSDRLYARERYDKLLGLDAPKQSDAPQCVHKIVKFVLDDDSEVPEVGPDEPNPNRYPGL